MQAALPPPPPLNELIERERIALFLDFDGTLVDLAPAPDAIVVPSDLQVRLERLTAKLEGRLALVSGRALDDLEGYIRLDNLACAGSHGVARRLAGGVPFGDEPKTLPIEVVAQMRNFGERYGLLYEEKTHGGALHYRTSPDRADPAIAFAEALADTYGLTAARGKGVVELVRPDADKGGAVRAFMTVPPFAGAYPVFVGDDLTDEHGIGAARSLGGFGIAVGERQSAAAGYHLAGVAAVHQWLGI